MGIMGELGERAARAARRVSGVVTSGVSSGARAGRRNAGVAGGVIDTTGRVTRSAKARPLRGLPASTRSGLPVHVPHRTPPPPPTGARRVPRPGNSLPVPRRNLPEHVPHWKHPAPPRGKKIPYAKIAGGAAIAGGGITMYRNNKKNSSSGQGLPPGSQTGIYGM